MTNAPLEYVTVKHQCHATQTVTTTVLLGYSLCTCSASIHTYRDSSGLHVSASRGMIRIVYKEQGRVKA